MCDNIPTYYQNETLNYEMVKFLCCFSIDYLKNIDPGFNSNTYMTQSKSVSIRSIYSPTKHLSCSLSIKPKHRVLVVLGAVKSIRSVSVLPNLWQQSINSYTRQMQIHHEAPICIQNLDRFVKRARTDWKSPVLYQIKLHQNEFDKSSLQEIIDSINFITRNTLDFLIVYIPYTHSLQVQDHKDLILTINSISSLICYPTIDIINNKFGDFCKTLAAYNIQITSNMFKYRLCKKTLHPVDTMDPKIRYIVQLFEKYIHHLTQFIKAESAEYSTLLMTSFVLDFDEAAFNTNKLNTFMNSEEHKINHGSIANIMYMWLKHKSSLHRIIIPNYIQMVAQFENNRSNFWYYYPLIRANISVNKILQNKQLNVTILTDLWVYKRWIKLAMKKNRTNKNCKLACIPYVIADMVLSYF